jgi:hypothetical protein
MSCRLSAVFSRLVVYRMTVRLIFELLFLDGRRAYGQVWAVGPGIEDAIFQNMQLLEAESIGPMK